MSEEHLPRNNYAPPELSYLHFSLAKRAKIARVLKFCCACVGLNVVKNITPSSLLLLAAEALFSMHLPRVCCCVFTDKHMKALFQLVNPDVNHTRIILICITAENMVCFQLTNFCSSHIFLASSSHPLWQTSSLFLQ